MSPWRCASLVFCFAAAGRAQEPAPVELPAVDIPVAPPPSEVEAGTGTGTRVDLTPRAGSGTTLADVLNEVPGVTVRRFGGVGAFTSVSMSGLGAQNVNIVLDDLPLSVTSV